jgi:hypothetical protein
MKITYQLSQEEYLQGVELHRKTGFKYVMITIYASLSLLFVLVFTDFSDTYTVIRNIIILFFSISFYVLFTKVIGTYQSKKIYEKSTTLNKEITLRISGKGIKVDNQERSISWDSFSKWKENEAFYIMYLNMRNFKIIPKRAMNKLEKKEFSNFLAKYLPQGKK